MRIVFVDEKLRTLVVNKSCEFWVQIANMLIKYILRLIIVLDLVTNCTSLPFSIPSLHSCTFTGDCPIFGR